MYEALRGLMILSCQNKGHVGIYITEQERRQFYDGGSGGLSELDKSG